MDQNAILADLHITKPKKRENGTYAGNIFVSEKERYRLNAPNSVIVGEKGISEAEKYIYIKNRKINNAICDLNKAVIDVVKENCYSWFKNNINAELVDEYYTNTIVYDKKYGDLIRLKVIDLEHEVPLNQPVHLQLDLVNIRFYKQKFVIEWVLQEVRTSTLDVRSLFDVEETDSEEEIALPLSEDMMSICDEYKCVLSDRKAMLEEEKERIEHKLKELMKLEEALGGVTSEESFFHVCENLDKFLE